MEILTNGFINNRMSLRSLSLSQSITLPASLPLPPHPSHVHLLTPHLFVIHILLFVQSQQLVTVHGPAQTTETTRGQTKAVSISIYVIHHKLRHGRYTVMSLGPDLNIRCRRVNTFTVRHSMTWEVGRRKSLIVASKKSLALSL